LKGSHESRHVNLLGRNPGKVTAVPDPLSCAEECERLPSLERVVSRLRKIESRPGVNDGLIDTDFNAANSGGELSNPQ